MSSDARPRRFLVTWRDSSEPARLHDIGCLSLAEGTWRFRYLPGSGTPGFQPLPGLPPDVESQSSELFPFFAERVPQRRRPDFAEYAAALDVPIDADDVEFLARSGGVTRGDRITLTEEPTVDRDGTTQALFVVRGLRFALEDVEVREHELAQLVPGAPLLLDEEEDNEVSSTSLEVCTENGTVLGWVPDALTAYARLVMADPQCALHVHKVNDSSVPPHSRLLVSLSGRVTPGSTVFPSLNEHVVVPA